MTAYKMKVQKMTRINLRGVIVPSIYDTDWTQEYITKGIITPESAFRRELEQIKRTVLVLELLLVNPTLSQTE